VTQPNDTVCKFVKVTLATTGAPVLALTSADFVFTGLKKEPGSAPTTYALAATVTEISAGFYAWEYLVPGVACNHGQHIDPVSSAHIVDVVTITGETESQDLASL
jgi:hypothetical protein